MTSSDDTTPRPTGRYHPACELLPEMSEAEFRELSRDIFEHGQRHPIIIDEAGTILDGRHRWRAITEMGRGPQVQVFYGDESEKVALVMSENIHRRHLTTEQRAAIAAELSLKLAEAAKQRQLAGKPIASDELRVRRPSRRPR
jgi:ParB-like chromosome segregation protein Spo0J